ncbi:aldehyde dehydrogenase family protein [candidate division KSB1 bacterium]|nr:aldehyde dehydrogenase family protein [candidate division KSB1 bacterium]RQW03846.1 MAG: aldehyde dehydrogenase family protein [candidate division KSB1 bacterium]
MPELQEILHTLDLADVNYGVSDGHTWFGHGKTKTVTSPINGQKIAEVVQGDAQDVDTVIRAAQDAFYEWRTWPAPKRGEIVRQFANELRSAKETLGKLVTIEMGKLLQEGWGEVQEMIDICDMAVGQSRMLYGCQTHSERPQHRMYEQWHPLGVVAVISAFNFPVAVWAWNAVLALVCGDAVLWKPANSVPLTAIACTKILQKVLAANHAPPAIATLLTGRGSDIGDLITADKRVPLVSYTGSTRLGKHIAEVVGARLGRTILELGGNNGIIVTQNADLKLAAQNILFGAIGTCGQRCTTTRRVIIQDVIYDDFKKLLLSCYDKVTIGSPLDETKLMGPMISTDAVEVMLRALDTIAQQGGTFAVRGARLEGDGYPGGCYVKPTVAEVAPDLPIVQEETFAPILYLIKYSGGLEQGIEYHNMVPQGLSSAIFTNDLLEAEQFLSALGSDCGIANVNLGTSGAEIGLAFGGEKETGGGRESGSDAWKSYMRRQTNTINYSGATVLAQGIKFD